MRINGELGGFKLTQIAMDVLSVFPNYSHSLFNGAQNRVETVVIILLAILLFFSSIGYLILWKVRWRIKKSKLISSLQTQFIYHMRQEKATEAAHHYQALAAAQAAAAKQGMMHFGHEEHPMESHYSTRTAEQIAPSQQSTLIAKRKLYFSAGLFLNG
jgi:hypothetical protein